MKRLAVLTSGGDAPGMNAAIRAVTRMGLSLGWQVYGVRHGFSGLIKGELELLGARDVGGIMQRGGTMLGSARCPEMKTEAGQMEALRQLHMRGVDSMVVIGGNGSQTGAHALSQRGLRVVGVASTIDNDLLGTDITIGATTAIDIALESIDRLGVTASSHQRGFFVEVMGRDCGYLATVVGIAGGAEAIIVPEQDFDPEAVAEEIRDAYQRGKSHAIIVVAEGAKHDADALSRYFVEHEARLGFDMRVCKLGHVQRGGVPGAADRLLATQLGAAAVEQLEAGTHGVLVGMRGCHVCTTPLDQVVGAIKPLDKGLLKIAAVLAH
jgi:6-phosphofructokinase 1